MSEISATDLTIPPHRQVTHTPDGIRFSVAEAQDAQARADDGDTPLPGDTELIAAYDGWLGQEWDRYWRRVEAEEYAAWLAEQCLYCGPDGSTGPDCGDCDGPEDA